MRLTKDFQLAEFACPCCGLANPSMELVQALQEYRDILGVPVRITSGGRCAASNERAWSHHLVARDQASRAADSIALGGKHLLDMYGAALRVRDFRGIGIYPRSAKEPLKGFIHLDTRAGWGRWARVEGVYVSHQEGLDFIHDSLIALGHRVRRVESFQGQDKTYHVPVLEES
jgi:hypothetical protein